MEEKEKTGGARVTEEPWESIRKLQEDSGLPEQDFVERLQFLYQMAQAKEKIPLFTEDINELETLVHRITGIFGNMIERMDTFTKIKKVIF